MRAWGLLLLIVFMGVNHSAPLNAQEKVKSSTSPKRSESDRQGQRRQLSGRVERPNQHARQNGNTAARYAPKCSDSAKVARGAKLVTSPA